MESGTTLSNAPAGTKPAKAGLKDSRLDLLGGSAGASLHEQCGETGDMGVAIDVPLSSRVPPPTSTVDADALVVERSPES